MKPANNAFPPFQHPHRPKGGRPRNHAEALYNLLAAAKGTLLVSKQTATQTGFQQPDDLQNWVKQYGKDYGISVWGGILRLKPVPPQKPVARQRPATPPGMRPITTEQIPTTVYILKKGGRPPKLVKTFRDAAEASKGNLSVTDAISQGNLENEDALKKWLATYGQAFGIKRVGDMIKVSTTVGENVTDRTRKIRLLLEENPKGLKATEIAERTGIPLIATRNWLSIHSAKHGVQRGENCTYFLPIGPKSKPNTTRIDNVVVAARIMFATAKNLALKYMGNFIYELRNIGTPEATRAEKQILDLSRAKG